MKQFILINGLVIFIGLIALVATVTAAGRRDDAALKERLSYLQDIPEVSWTVFVKNRVYVGFKKKIPDMISICRYAAYYGNEACGCSVRVYAVSAASGYYKTAERYGYAVARRGRIVKSRPCFEWV